MAAGFDLRHVRQGIRRGRLRCATVTGTDLATLLPVVQDSNQLTRFVDRRREEVAPSGSALQAIRGPAHSDAPRGSGAAAVRVDRTCSGSGLSLSGPAAPTAPNPTPEQVLLVGPNGHCIGPMQVNAANETASASVKDLRLRASCTFPFRGAELLERPLLNKTRASTTTNATSSAARAAPARMSTIEEQVSLELEHIGAKRRPRALHRPGGTAGSQRNALLSLSSKNLEEFMPIVYTRRSAGFQPSATSCGDRESCGSRPPTSIASRSLLLPGNAEKPELGNRATGFSSVDWTRFWQL